MIQSRARLHRLREGSIALALALLIGCAYELYPAPITGYESDDVNCSDGIDNDDDGAIDCADPDCIYFSTHCGLQIPNIPPSRYPEREALNFSLPEEGSDLNGDGEVNGEDQWIICHDQIDNDNDGNYDCGDRSCSNIREMCCAREFDNTRCSDGIDNDQNGYTDCQDFGCRMNPFVSVCREDDLGLCTDGVDNDGDGRIDCEDRDCLRIRDDAILAQIQVFCGAVPEEDQAACSDGIDNNFNGYTDCEDFSCSRSIDPGVSQYCAGILAQAAEEEAAPPATSCPSGPIEGSVEGCRDGCDNDGNGFIDCEDFACSRSRDPQVRSLCVESAYVPDDFPSPAAEAEARRVADENCSNDIDEDLDGFVNCADTDCSWNPLVSVCSGPKVCE